MQRVLVYSSGRILYQTDGKRMSGLNKNEQIVQKSTEILYKQFITLFTHI